MGYSRLLRKVAERVLRDITIIIFRRFSESSSLHLLREQHMQNHKITGMQVKRQRSMRITSSVKGDCESSAKGDGESSAKGDGESPAKGDSESPAKEDSPTMQEATRTPILPSSPQAGWDAAALRIITFLSSRINPNVTPRRR